MSFDPATDDRPALAVAIPLRLRPDSRPDPAELWLLSDRPEERLTEFVADSDQRLVDRFTFALARRGEETVVLLHGRAERGAPPVVIGVGTPFSAVARFANCFQPHGLGLRPPLRRDVLRRLFANDPTVVTWFAAGPGGAAEPQTVPAAAFRPLSDAVEYVVEAELRLFTAVTARPPLEFLDFTVINDRPAKNVKPEAETTPPDDMEISLQTTAAPPVRVVKGRAPARRKIAALAQVVADAVPRLTAMPDKKLRRRLAERQREFLSLAGPPDAPARRALWPELADLHGATDHPADAAACWGYALWDAGSPPADWMHAWLRAEREAAGTALTPDRIDQILTEPSPPAGMVRHLAAGLVASLALPVSPHLRVRLGALPPFLERHEAALPVRVAWLAWLALARLAGGDVLTLARARDRLLQQLLDVGLSRDRDLPAFLRDREAGAGVAGADHARLTDMLLKAREWAVIEDAKKQKHGRDYRVLIDLTFAFGFARVGEAHSARKLLADVERRIRDDQTALNWLRRAYEYRVECALANQPPSGGLPPALLRELAAFPGPTAAAIDRYRRVSRVLEPFERIDPYRNHRFWAARRDTLGEQLAALADEVDPAKLTDSLNALQKKTGPHSAVRVFAAALSFAPRVGEAFTLQVLADLEHAIRKVPFDQNAFQAVEVLESAMLLSAHYGREERVPSLFRSLRDLLAPLRGERLAWLVGHLNGQLFRTLAKLGLRDTVHELADRLFDDMLEGRALDKLRRAPAVNWGIVLRALLQVAGGWFYTGRDGPATAILDEAFARLNLRTLRDEEQALLAAAYATTLGQAPPVVTWPRVRDLFDRLTELDVPHANADYHLCVFRTVESALLAVVAKDFAGGSEVRRWLDEDEHLVRRRIHADVRREMTVS
jgi:hypothetical protein